MTPTEKGTKIFDLLKEIKNDYGRIEKMQTSINEKVVKMGDLIGSTEKDYNKIEAAAMMELGRIHFEELKAQ